MLDGGFKTKEWYSNLNKSVCYSAELQMGCEMEVYGGCLIKSIDTRKAKEIARYIWSEQSNKGERRSFSV